MQTSLTGRADVHSGPPTDSLQALQNRNRTCIVGQTELHPASEAHSPAPQDVATSRSIHFTFGYRQSGPSWPLAVRVARPAAAGYPPAAALPGRRRAADLDPADGPVAELGVEPPDQLRGEQPDLGGPGRRFGGHRELAVGERLRRGVRGQVPADDLGPPAEDRPDRGPLLPALLVEQAADGVAQELRVVPAGPARAHGGRAGGPGRE